MKVFKMFFVLVAYNVLDGMKIDLVIYPTQAKNKNS